MKRFFKNRSSPRRKTSSQSSEYAHGTPEHPSGSTKSLDPVSPLDHSREDADDDGQMNSFSTGSNGLGTPNRDDHDPHHHSTASSQDEVISRPSSSTKTPSSGNGKRGAGGGENHHHHHSRHFWLFRSHHPTDDKERESVSPTRRRGHHPPPSSSPASPDSFKGLSTPKTNLLTVNTSTKSTTPASTDTAASSSTASLPPGLPAAAAAATTTITASGTATNGLSPNRFSMKDRRDPPLVPEEADADVQNAIVAVERGIKLDDDTRAKISIAVRALDQAGNDLFQKGQYDAAFERYERALKLKRRTLLSPRHREANGDENKNASDDDEMMVSNSVLASVATSINNMTYLKQRSGQANADETMASYLKSLQIKRDILGPDHLSVGKTLNNIGSVFYLKQEYEAALTAYMDAHRILKQNLGEDHLDVGTVISNMADVHSALGDSEKALEQYRLALVLRWKVLGPKDPRVIRLMEQIARLETGDQPEQGRGSGNTADGALHPDGEQQQEEMFIEDIKALQQELHEDLKYFDLLERQMAIDMLKDKTQILREMRDLANHDGTENIGDFKMPQLPAKDAQTRIVEEASSSSSEELMIAFGNVESQLDAALLSDFVSTSSTSESLPVHTGTAPSASNVEATPPLEQLIANRKPAIRVDTLEQSVETTHQVKDDGKVSLSIPTHETHNINDTSSQRKVIMPKYTPQQRERALLSVRERLENLRAKRFSEQSKPSVTIPTDHRHYMEPTASSAAKATTPCASSASRRLNGDETGTGAMRDLSELALT